MLLTSYWTGLAIVFENDGDFQFTRQPNPSKTTNGAISKRDLALTRITPAALPAAQASIVSLVSAEKPKRQQYASVAGYYDSSHFGNRGTAGPSDAKSLRTQATAQPRAAAALPTSNKPTTDERGEARKKGSPSDRHGDITSRGRPAGQLHNGCPAHAVATVDVYKSIPESLPEPERMRQLLSECGKRAFSANAGVGCANRRAGQVGAFS